MSEARLKRRLGWLEIVLYGSGITLLAVFFFIRFEGERARQDGIEAFEQALRQADEVQAEPVRDSSAVADASDGLPAMLPGDYAPDQALWSEQRIRAFEASVQADEPPLAVLRIESLDLAVPVFDGTSDDVLDRGAGRVRGTARIDDAGNLGIAGHRDSFFRPLKDIQKGDRIELRTAGGTVTYSVSSIDIVEPEDVSVLAPTEERTLTLVTCYPFYYVGHAPRRFIVKATAEHSLAKT